MKHRTEWIAIAASLAGGFAGAGSAQAQSVTGDPTLDNIPPASVAAYYSSWATQPPTVVSDGASGFEVKAGGYGSLYYAVPGAQQQSLSTADNQVSLTFTINGPAGSYYVGVPFAIGDNSGNYFYGGYSTYGPGTYTETAPLDPTQQAAIAAGGDTIYSFNLEFDPAGNLPNGGGAGPYDITFNSLALSSSVPEPSTFALIGSGVAAFFASRRRKM